MNLLNKIVQLSALVGITVLTITACGGKDTPIDKAVVGETTSIKHPTFSWKKVQASNLYKPTGTIQDTTPTFEWTAIAGVNTYQIGHEDVYNEQSWRAYTVTAEQAGCNAATSCSFTPSDIQLAVGDFKAWWVRGKKNSGWEQWSSTHVFKIAGKTSTPKLTLKPVFPAGQITTNTPTFKWVPNTGASHYQIGYEIIDGSGWHRISLDADNLNCESGQCEYTIGDNLQSGVNMTWWVRSKINGHYGSFGEGLHFTIEKSHNNFRELIPEDSNTALGGETDIVYIADIREEDGGKNRAIRIDAQNMEAEIFDIKKGSNPHSIDRAGDSNKFYVRTQSSTSISVINFETGSEKTVDLGDLFPRTAGATNLKYGIQLISSHNKPVISIIDVKTDKIIGRVGDETVTAPNMANGHPVWFDNDHFGLVDRVNNDIRVYKVRMRNGKRTFGKTDVLRFKSSAHIAHTMVKVSPNKFFVMGEGDVDNDIRPFISKIEFNDSNGTLQILDSTTLKQSDKRVKGVDPVLHHGGISPNGEHFYATNLDGKTYIIDRESMEIEKVIETGLGAGHVQFSEAENVAIITSHFATYVTIIDLDTLEVKAEIEISNTQFDEDNRKLMQLHNPLVSKDGRYFFTAASQDGDFVKIDLRKLKVDSKLHVGGILDQTSS